MSLGVTRKGMPLGCEIFPDNKADVSTVEGGRRFDGGAIWKGEPRLVDGSRDSQPGQPRMAAPDGPALRDRHVEG